MKYGINLYLWADDMHDGLMPVLEKLKKMGYDGVEVPIFDLDREKWKLWSRRLNDLGIPDIISAPRIRAGYPAEKPAEIAEVLIRQSSAPGDVVADPFMGSGTTILAAERVGRRGYGLELDPLYVDVAVRRWQAYTRRDATLKSTGQTFDEIAAVRSKTRGPR